MKKSTVLVCFMLVAVSFSSVVAIHERRIGIQIVEDQTAVDLNDSKLEIPGSLDRDQQGDYSGNVITFRDDQIMLLNGKPFFPIGLYRERSEPWNSVNTYWQFPRDIRGYSGDVMHVLGETLFSSYFEREYDEAIQCLDHPNFLAWHSADEPVWNYERGIWDVTFEDLLMIYNRLDLDDLYHPVWMNFCAADVTDDLDIWIQKRRQWSQAADIVSIDVYPKWANPGPWDDQCCGCGPNGCGLWCVLDNCNISVVGDYVDVLINNVTEGQKPVWIVPQAWGAVNEFEIRFQSWQAIIHGATGIFYWHQGGYELVMPDAANVAQELVDLHPLLVAETIDATVTDTPGIATMIKEIEGYYFILAVNEASEPVQGVTTAFDITELGITNGYVELLNEDTTVDVVDGLFTVDFDQFDTHIMQVTPWWDEDWSSCLRMEINHTKVLEDQTDFPVLMYREADEQLALHAQTDGSDIVFVDAMQTTTFNHEIEYFNSTTG